MNNHGLLKQWGDPSALADGEYMILFNERTMNMDKTIFSNKYLRLLCLGLIVFSQSAIAFARPNMGVPQGRAHREQKEVVVRHVPEHCRYRDGRFYKPSWFGLFEVAVSMPHIGASITVLPIGHKTKIVGGRTYYCYDDIYFTSCPSGYVVVPAPVVHTNVAVASSGAITVNVPNSNGSYSPVTLIKQNDGYIGPQGEYYPSHPTVEQLKVLYGK
jgi:hypothetical protein